MRDVSNTHYSCFLLPPINTRTGNPSQREGQLCIELHRAARRLMLKMAGRWEKREEEMEPPSGFHRGIPRFNVKENSAPSTPPPLLCRVCFS